MLPEEGLSLDVIILKVVDLPAPFGPSNPKTVPSSTPKDVPFTARKPLLYYLAILMHLTESLHSNLEILFASFKTSSSPDYITI
jgi:hypothetical protein